MATFLELVKDLARESGTLAGGIGISSVNDPTGRADKMVSWIRKAWINIQNERSDWPWMKREFSAALTIGKRRYTAAELGITTRFAQWIGDRPRFCTFTLYDPSIGQADEGAIREVPYDTWRARYSRGLPDADRPTVWAVSPAQEFCVGTIPDKAYVVTGEYRVSPQVLAANNDVPEMPQQYHNVILLEALKLLGLSDESPATSGGAISEYVLARQNLNRDYLPEITIPGMPLA